MERFLQQIEGGLQHGLYQLALFSSLSIPSICGAMESDDGCDTRERYKEWFNTYMSKRQPDKYGNGKNFTADDCYYYRCAVLHQGYSAHHSLSYKRIIFIDPSSPSFSSIGSIHCCLVGVDTDDESLLINIETFCSDLIQCAREWFDVVRDTETYQANHRKILQRYPEGVGPVRGCATFG